MLLCLSEVPATKIKIFRPPIKRTVLETRNEIASPIVIGKTQMSYNDIICSLCSEVAFVSRLFRNHHCQWIKGTCATLTMEQRTESAKRNSSTTPLRTEPLFRISMGLSINSFLLPFFFYLLECFRGWASVWWMLLGPIGGSQGFLSGGTIKSITVSAHTIFYRFPYPISHGPRGHWDEIVLPRRDAMSTSTLALTVAWKRAGH